MADESGGKSLEVHYATTWAGVYVDGQLDGVYEHATSVDRALELAGVKVVYDNAFLRGHKNGPAAQTLEEVEEYKKLRLQIMQQALDLETRAHVLLEQARELREQQGLSVAGESS